MQNTTLAKMTNRLWPLAVFFALGLTACSAPPPASPTGTANAPQCEASTSLATVQGSGPVSPLADQQVVVTGTVTASWQQSGQLGGFFIEQHADGQAAALFVQTETPRVEIGDRVAVTGIVREHQQLTQLDEVSQLQLCGKAELPQPYALRLPVTTKAELEQLEGRFVSLPQALVVNGTYLLGRHGSFDVASERLYTPTQRVEPGPAARAYAQANELKRLVIDDNQAPAATEIPYPSPQLNASNTLRSGDTVSNITGILSEFNGSYRIQPMTELNFLASNPRPAAPPRNDDRSVLRIATFNVLNYFNGDGATHEFPTERGAATAADFARQEAKIIAALAALDADVVGLMEIENDGYASHSAIVRLTRQLAAATGAPWQFVHAADGQFGGASITNGLIYRTDRVDLLGETMTITEGPFSNRSRYPLIQRMQPKGTEEAFVVAVNHFKSKGSCPRDETDPNANQHDGQACWNAARVQSAELLVEFMQSQPILASTPAQILLGDFNAYAKEDPMTLMSQAGFHNRAEHFEPLGYSYVYDAQAGSLDHLLVSAALHGRVLQQHHWLINADEPPALSYQGYSQNPDWYAPTPYRSSDHDPIVADIQF
ncbi:ExeM/NucH family extracellular endonuclease [Pseudidiomarina sp. 1APP75-32.1]|uniref:ExeM/NucH family extracellular endonuclease n=1 Tax=Pseudidiomarina terrestris TaxID=2820060 RepID=A0AAW7R0G0_9GAMM|nr:ExeM/NucH family extracellular endonuclease [Pseudidiomarina sp. 1APP75-32.1]MDN7124039.1 ExeM/NucH family extracellular endonuclease [Pseudidiomarina sp. 1APP75-32.1]